MIGFTCGCEAKITPPIDDAVLKTHDSIVIDGEGFLTCLVHRGRIKGWRSVPYAILNMPRKPRDYWTEAERRNFRNGRRLGRMLWPVWITSNWTPLEWERFRIFGEIPPEKVVNVDMQQTLIEA